MYLSAVSSEELRPWGIAFGQNYATKLSSQRLETVRFRRIPYQDPLKIFSRLCNNFDFSYLLESIEGPRKLAEFSFIGFGPKKMVSVKNGKTEIVEDCDRSVVETCDPLGTIGEAIRDYRIPHDRFRFVGGAVGYVSYDAVRYWENLSNAPMDDLNLPDIEMGIYDDGIVFDHVDKKSYYYCLNESRFEEIEESLRKPLSGDHDLSFREPKLNVSKEAFEESVRKARRYIFDGDIFQVVLSKRYEFGFDGSLVSFYRALREINPSPYMYFLKHGERQVVGASPEMLVRVENRFVETYPIAGTRPMVEDSMKNAVLKEELLSDPKERAEHIMLVDLARNDIGRVSDHGSVAVPELMYVHQYSHVQHIVSRVVGHLSPDKDCFDSLRVMLPAGTVSGAPKVRAMEIIDELERTRRGPYAGAVGYFSYNGNSDFAITIRTLVADGNRAYIQAGGGIVADSDPESEWFETENKAAALMKALHKAGDRT